MALIVGRYWALDGPEPNLALAVVGSEEKVDASIKGIDLLLEKKMENLSNRSCFCLYHALLFSVLHVTVPLVYPAYSHVYESQVCHLVTIFQGALTVT